MSLRPPKSGNFVKIPLDSRELYTSDGIVETRLNRTRECRSHHHDELGILESGIISLLESTRSLIIVEKSQPYSRIPLRHGNSAVDVDSKQSNQESPKRSNLKRVFEKQCQDIESELYQLVQFVREENSKLSAELLREHERESELESELETLRLELGGQFANTIITPSPLVDEDIAEIFHLRDKLLSQITDDNEIEDFN
jgi:hypothetical protein